MLDANIQRRILEELYDKWREDFAHHVLLESLNINGISQEALVANAEYLVSKNLIEEPQTMQFWTRITVFGIAAVEDRRVSPDVKVRRRMLEILKELYEKDPYSQVDGEFLVQHSGFSISEILRNAWYLGKIGLIEVQWFLGGNFRAKISAGGIDSLIRPTEFEQELNVMSSAYSLLYSLENQLRIFIERKLGEAYGDQWLKCIPDAIVVMAQKLKSGEVNSTLSLLNYMQFGHLSLIIGKNWRDFKDTFNNPAGVVSRLNELEDIRHKIAHCRILSNDDLAKLEFFHKEILEMLTNST